MPTGDKSANGGSSAISTEQIIQRVADSVGKSYATVVSAMSRHPEATEPALAKEK